ncbi:MAG: hypothetical protein R3F19_28740 [Verrucomicrobiales bacterium]
MIAFDRFWGAIVNPTDRDQLLGEINRALSPYESNWDGRNWGNQSPSRQGRILAAFALLDSQVARDLTKAFVNLNWGDLPPTSWAIRVNLEDSLQMNPPALRLVRQSLGVAEIQEQGADSETTFLTRSLLYDPSLNSTTKQLTDAFVEPKKATPESDAPASTDQARKALAPISAIINGQNFRLVSPDTVNPLTRSRAFQERYDAASPSPLLTPDRVSDAGAFKAPSLRNVELTGPYMHNGSLLTLETVIDFYAEGGDYSRRIKANESDFLPGDLHPEMAPFLLSSEQKQDLIAFLRSLTDERVRHERAPFDHPSLPLPIGIKRESSGRPAQIQTNGLVEYDKVTIEAVGKNGRQVGKIRSLEERLQRLSVEEDQ